MLGPSELEAALYSNSTLPWRVLKDLLTPIRSLEVADILNAAKLLVSLFIISIRLCIPSTLEKSVHDINGFSSFLLSYISLSEGTLIIFDSWFAVSGVHDVI